jgi:hypothetical protein
VFLSAPFVPLVVAVVLLFQDECRYSDVTHMTLTELRERLHKRDPLLAQFDSARSIRGERTPD